MMEASEQSPCGCHVTTGAKIIGIIGVIIYSLLLLLTILGAVAGSADSAAQQSPIYITIPWLVLCLIAESLLIVGAIKKNDKLHIPWLIIFLLGLIYGFYLIGLSICHLIAGVAVGLVLPVLVITILSILLNVFCAWIVWCSYEFCKSH